MVRARDLVHNPSLLTLSSATTHPDEVHCWRGLGLWESLQHHEQRSKEFARYQKDCHREYGARHLQMVKELQSKALQRLQEEGDHDGLSDSEAGSDGHGNATSAILETTEKLVEVDSVEKRRSVKQAQNDDARRNIMFALQEQAKDKPSSSSRPAEQQPASSTSEPEARVTRRASVASINTDKFSRSATPDGQVSATSAATSAATNARRTVNTPQSMAGSMLAAMKDGGVMPPVMGRRGSMAWEAQAAAAKRVAKALAARKARKQERITNKMQDRMAGLRRRLQTRMAEFDALPALEQERMHRAFKLGLALQEGSGGHRHQLNETGLLAALAEIDLASHIPEEKEAIRSALQAFCRGGTHVGMAEFVLNVAPAVDEALQQCRKYIITRYFHTNDSRHVGRLRQPECIQALREVLVAMQTRGGRRRSSFIYSQKEREIEGMHPDTWMAWESFMQKFPTILKKTLLLNSEQEISESAFQMLATQLMQHRNEHHFTVEKRMSTSLGLTKNVEKQHFGELQPLKALFEAYVSEEEHDEADGEHLSFISAMSALMHRGALAPVGKMPDQARQMIRKTGRTRLFGKDDNGEEELEDDRPCINFMDFLYLVNQMREIQAHVCTSAVERVLMEYFGNAEKLHARDLPKMIVKAGLCVESCSTMFEVHQAVEECNFENFNLFTSKELARLLTRTVEHTRSVAREREQEVAKTYRFSTAQVLEFRTTWNELSALGVAGIAEVRKVIETVKGKRMSDTEVQSLVLDVQPVPSKAPLPISKHRFSLEEDGPTQGDGATLEAVKEENEQEGNDKGDSRTRGSSSCSDSDSENLGLSDDPEDEEEDEGASQVLAERLGVGVGAKQLRGMRRLQMAAGDLCRNSNVVAVLRFDGYLRLLARLIER